MNLRDRSSTFQSLLILLLVAATSAAVPAQGNAQPIELLFERPPADEEPPPNNRGGDEEEEFAIVLNFATTLPADQEASFVEATNRWRGRIFGYKPGITNRNLTITISSVVKDGRGGSLGSAGPTIISFQAGYMIAVEGMMEFDAEDLSYFQSIGVLTDIIEHEMGHVLGIGVLWLDNDDYQRDSYQYTGPEGLAAWREFPGQSGANVVPVEDEGGAFTANGHWDEVVGGLAAVGITDAHGRDMKNELMTGWLNLPAFYSDLTHAQLRDLGFLTEALPEILLISSFETGDLTEWSLTNE